MNKMKIIEKVNSEVVKSPLGVSVQKGWIKKKEKEYLFRMLVKTPYGRVSCGFYIPPELIEDESVIVKIVSYALIDEIKEYKEKK